MKTKLTLYWDRLRSSYWFVPSLMAVLAVIAASVAVYVDGRAGQEWMRGVDLLYRNEPDGARQLLSSVAGSMIGVAGVTFSITIASVVYASGSFGPRVLSNFMADRGNQLTLGTFIATFLYCLMVLRTVRAPGESAPHGVEAFVPHLAITLALILALASVAVFIYFLHHVPQSIHVSHVIAGIGRDLAVQIDALFPDEVGDEHPDDPSTVAARGDSVVRSTTAGFLQSVDGDGLIALAKRHDRVLRLLKRPGDFVGVGDALVEMSGDRAPEAATSAAIAAFAIGDTRTALQDVRFPADELVEIAIRALSPGINDPFTAMACIGWLTSGFKQMAAKRIPSALRRDDDGTVRLIAPSVTFEELVDGSLRMLLPHAQREPTVIRYLRECVREVFDRTSLPSRRIVLEHYIDPLADGAA